MNEVSTEPEVVNEPDNGVNEEVVDRDTVFEMDSEEFDKFTEELNESDTKDKDKSEPEQDNIDLNELYKTQLEKPFDLDKPILIKVDGTVMDINNSKDAKDLMEKGLKFTQKSQQLAKYRDTIGYLEDNGLLDPQVLHQALTQGIQEPLQEPQQDTDNNVSRVNDVAQNILNSEYANDMKSLIGSMPENVKEQLSNDDRLLSGLFQDVQSGFAQKIMPEVIRNMNIKGMNFIDAYFEAGNNLSKTEPQKQILRSEPKQRGSAKKHQLTREDIFDMNPEEFAKFTAKLK